MSSTRQSMILPIFHIACSRLSAAHCLAVTKSLPDSLIAKATWLLTPTVSWIPDYPQSHLSQWLTMTALKGG